MLLVFLGTLAATVWLLQITPKGFFPQEDIGQLSVSTEARQDISFEAMVELQQQGRRRLRALALCRPCRPRSSAAAAAAPAR